MNYTLIVPILNKPELLDRLFRSIREDETPSRLLVIDNGFVYNSYYRLNFIPDDCRDKFKDTTIGIQLFKNNAGVSASWNYGIKVNDSCTGEPWVVSNFDLIFSEGSIKKLLEPLQNGYDLVTLERGYCLWGANKSLFDKVGYFDENFFPAYIEDLDFDRRVQLHPDVKKVTLALPEIIHESSSTVRGHYNKPLGDVLHELRELNELYYIKKWGGKHGQEEYDLPFGSKPLSYWELDKEFLKRKKEIWNEKLVKTKL